MKISSLKELLFANELKSANISNVDEFVLQGNLLEEKLSGAFCYFAKDENGFNFAKSNNAYVIIVDFIPSKNLLKGEFWCFLVDNLTTSAKKLLNFLARDKTFYLCNNKEKFIAKKLGQNILNDDIFMDFNQILKKDIFFSDNKKYLKSISNPKDLKNIDFELLSNKNFFYTSLKIKNIQNPICDIFGDLNDIYFENIILPKHLIQAFCNIWNIVKKYTPIFHILFKNQKCIIFLEQKKDFEILNENQNIILCENNEKIFDEKAKFVAICMSKDEFLDKIHKQDNIFNLNLDN